MKIPCLLFLLVLSGTAVAQLPISSPVKLGLWRTDSTTKISGTGMQESSETKAVRACVDEETWKKFMGVGQQGEKCEKKETYSNHIYSLDFACGSDDKLTQSNSGHLVMTFDSTEAAHATMSMDTHLAKDQVMHISSVLKTRYLAASCGDVKPGEDEDIK